MRITRKHVGTTAGHRAQPATAVTAFGLDNGGGLAVTVWTYGATLVEVLVPGRAGHRSNVTVRLPDLVSYEDRRRNQYVGSVLGRYCRCVAGGRFSLDGVTYQLDRGEDRHHLHGGPAGFDRFVWEADAGPVGGAAAVRLRLRRPDGDQGYPGAVDAEVSYTVHQDDRLEIDFRATSTAATIIGLTSHAFWNLAGAGRIDGHRLAINASRYLPADAEFIPLPGPTAEVAGTPLDYRAPTVIGTSPIDYFFALDDQAWAAELHDPATGRRLLVTTDQPGLGCYSGDGLTWPRAGLCLQTSAWPDAPNRPDYPSCRLDPGEVYRHRAVYEFSAH